MNTTHLGDALDHWKGSLLELLQEKRLLTKLAVDPMITDHPLWQERDWNLYAKLLRIRPDQIIRHVNPLSHPRADYFNEICHEHDLFLDPDVGIATGQPSPISKYLKPSELQRLVERQPSRIIAVYQHVRATSTRSRLEQIIFQLPRPLCLSTYESATVVMLFFSRDVDRIKDIHTGLNQFLDHKGPDRTTFNQL